MYVYIHVDVSMLRHIVGFGDRTHSHRVGSRGRCGTGAFFGPVSSGDFFGGLIEISGPKQVPKSGGNHRETIGKP